MGLSFHSDSRKRGFMPYRILLTGGAGFIGSHTYLALVAAGYEVAILDNFENARRDVPDRLGQITGTPVEMIEADIRDAPAMGAAMSRGFDAVVHFAALKSVPLGEADPLGYFQSNCAGLMNVMSAMRDHDVSRIVFSSSAAIYGNTERVPITEDTPPAPVNVYARTKVFGEDLLNAMAAADQSLAVGILRYFNPVGAHPSGLIGEDPHLPPTNLVPVIARVATGRMPLLKVFGTDYPTPDGSGVRDYIHVEDLARGHVLSLDALFRTGKGHLVNLGTGQGHSVLDVIAAYETVAGRTIPHEKVARRPGDPAISFADAAKARAVLGFEAQHDLAEMCASNWAFSKAQLA
jgi:UDP-glucose 4-epimerase